MNRYFKKYKKNWKVLFDPYNFLCCEDWYTENIEDEDILQMEYKSKNITLDVGYYSDGKYRIYVIKGENWRKPIRIVEVLQKSTLNSEIEKILSAY